jgi:hypothetical protein
MHRDRSPQRALASSRWFAFFSRFIDVLSECGPFSYGLGLFAKQAWARAGEHNPEQPARKKPKSLLQHAIETVGKGDASMTGAKEWLRVSAASGTHWGSKQKVRLHSYRNIDGYSVPTQSPMSRKRITRYLAVTQTT